MPTQKKVKRKLKLKVRIALYIILFLITVSLTLLLYSKHNQPKDYSKYMSTVSNTYLYKKNKFSYKKVGILYKNNKVIISKAENNYYKTKDGYYIKYKDLKKSTKPEDTKYNGIVFNKNIIIKKNMIIYKNNSKYFKINKKFEIKLLEKGDKFYKGIYNDEIIEVKKEDIEKEIDKHNTDQETTESIPVLKIDNITEEKLTEVLEYISKEKYNTISKADYILWQKGYKNLPVKTVFIINEQEDLNSIFNKYKILYSKKNNKLKLIENDAFSTKTQPYCYTINKFTGIARVKDILNGIKLDEKDYAQAISVLNYHFFYDETTGVCDEVICLKKEIFQEEMKYLRNNNYKTLTMEEYYKWLLGEIELPKKSVLLTIDDGAMGTDNILPNVLDEYNQKATLFLITSFWEMSKYRVGNLEIQSHSHSLHDRNFCKGDNCDIKTLVLTKDEIKEDLQKSKEIIGNPIAYCYPFYKYDQKTIDAVKEEFSLAFAGGNRKSTRKDNKYLIPRYVVAYDITMDEFIDMID